MRVSQVVRRLSLRLKTSHHCRLVAQMFVQKLERNHLLRQDLKRLIHAAHTACSEQFDYFVFAENCLSDNRISSCIIFGRQCFDRAEGCLIGHIALPERRCGAFTVARLTRLSIPRRLWGGFSKIWVRIRLFRSGLLRQVTVPFEPIYPSKYPVAPLFMPSAPCGMTACWCSRPDSGIISLRMLCFQVVASCDSRVINVLHPQFQTS